MIIRAVACDMENGIDEIFLAKGKDLEDCRKNLITDLNNRFDGYLYEIIEEDLENGFNNLLNKGEISNLFGRRKVASAVSVSDLLAITDETEELK